MEVAAGGSESDLVTMSELTAKQLKSKIRQTLKNSGVLGTVKAQLRQEFLNGLQGNSLSAAAQAKHALGVRERITYSLVYHLLQSRGLTNSTSVFVAETGLQLNATLISEKDVVQTLRFNKLSKSFKLASVDVANRRHSVVQMAETYELDHTITKELVDKNHLTLLDLLIHYCSSVCGNDRQDMSCQTDAAGPSAREVLNIEIDALRRKHLEQYETSKSQLLVEERIIAYQRESEEHAKRDVELQMEFFRQHQLEKVRLEESIKSRMALESLRKELIDEYDRRLLVYIEREEINNRSLAEKERSINQRGMEERQLMQREIDELRSRDQMLSRKVELESQGLRSLELRLKASQNVLESREREIGLRETALEEKNKTITITARQEALDRVKVDTKLSMFYPNLLSTFICSKCFVMP